ncbi:uncharacterized protein LOC115919086 [Strongylocentrotus purpuratus]|uniref:Uncharacterized protein n=1 Tax=Strongylocentrotus purpuratus TaxID=7668 RepID=A0A7M7T5I5_STRPU|nr:uncharacterized protein LOC115919086 [Strongylocentrotus purpuratus]
MAAPCVSCEISLKSGERTNIKCVLATNDGKFSRQSVRDAISKVQADVNAFLTVQVEKEKQESAQLKSSGVRPHAKSGAAGDAGGAAGGEGDLLTSVTGAGDDSDDVGLEEDEDDEEEDVPKNADNDEDQTGKREAKDWDSTSSKKSKLSDS